MDAKLTNDEKIRIAAIATQFCQTTIFKYDEVYKKLVDLIENHKSKE